MEIQLSKKPKNAILVEGFPGFGLVGTISTEFLIEHLKCEKIGTGYLEDMPATIAVHNKRVIEPIEVYYHKKKNLVIIHSIAGAPGLEWKAADIVLSVAKQCTAKEIISLEGVASQAANPHIYFHSTVPKNDKKLSGLGLTPLKEGIVVGVTSALMVKTKTHFTGFFAETQSALPDSHASAKVIEALNSYLTLDVDIKPLLKSAQEFEDKLKGLLEQSQMAKDEVDKKRLSYMG